MVSPNKPTIHTRHNIPYNGDDPSNPTDKLRCFDFYYIKPQEESNEPLPPLICYVHGGAWRSEDKGDHLFLGLTLSSETSCAVAIMNYHLTTPETPAQHPAHAEDLLQFLHFIVGWGGPENEPKVYDPSRMFLLGHSCAAHMLTSIYLSPSAHADPAPSLVPSTQLLKTTRGIILSQGIYDLDLLLQSYPKYRYWFIVPAFGDRTSYELFDTTQYRLREGGEGINWFIIHSRGDGLVDVLQSEKLYRRLQEVLEAPKSSSQSSRGEVEFDDSLTVPHDQVPKDPDYMQIVKRFVTKF